MQLYDSAVCIAELQCLGTLDCGLLLVSHNALLWYFSIWSDFCLVALSYFLGGPSIIKRGGVFLRFFSARLNSKTCCLNPDSSIVRETLGEGGKCV